MHQPISPRDAARRFQAGELGGPALMRAFGEHPRWRTPAYANGGQPQVQLFAGEGDTRALWLFSDDVAWHAARPRLSTGDSYLEASGAAWFATLDEAVTRVVLDPLTPHAMHYRRAQLPTVRAMGQAIALEQALAAPERAGTALLGMLHRYSAFRILLTRDGNNQLLLAPERSGRRMAAVCTAPDSTDAFVARVRHGRATDTLRVVTLDGRTLFQQLRALPLDGIVFNPAGPPTPRAFVAALAEHVLAAHE